MPTKSGSPTPLKGSLNSSLSSIALIMSQSSLSSLPNLLENPRQSPQSEAEVETPIESTTPGPSVFDQTTQNLLRLGSLTLDKFAQDPSEELDGFDIPLVDPANPNATGYYLGDTTATRNTNKAEEEPGEIPIVAPNEAVRYLRDIAQREFGTTSFDPLKYEYLEEPGQTGKRCILTINRPNGLSRSYRTKAEFSRKSDAKTAAASSAIKLGAVSFIKRGDISTVGGKRGLVLAKLDAGVKKDEGDMVIHLKNPAESQGGDDIGGERMIAEIERCCFEWRAGSVVPRWVILVEKKNPDAYGCALKICLSSHVQRTYSVLISIQYARRSLAKGACAKLALEQGVLEFIKHGDGLKDPIIVPFVGAEAMPLSAPPTLTTLQAFHAALPKPMPDHIVTKSNGEINAVAWVNTMVQTAKGSRMSVAFQWYMDSKVGLHGCLLRLSRPDGPSQSYLVDSIFSKRSDAKLAVCLLACSQGLGDYIRGVVAEIEARISTEMRQRCTEQILPALGQALNKVRHGLRPDFEYECDLSTFGCTLTINLSSDPNSEIPVSKQWKIPLAYKSKVDAKIAVVCAAADDGLMNFIKYRGQPPLTPDDQASEIEVVNEIAEVELEDGETTVENGKKKKNKKAKKDDGDSTGEVRDSKMKRTGRTGNAPLFETKEEARARGRFDAAPGKKLQHRNFSGRGRGAGFGRHGGFGHTNIRGGFAQSSDAPARRRTFGRPGGYPTHSNFPQFYPPHSHFPPHASRAAAHIHPYPFVPPAGGLGFPGGLYPLEYEHRDYFLGDPGLAHERYSHGLGGLGVDTATSFTHAPPPVLPHVMPDYHGYHDRDRSYDFTHECDYGEGLTAQPSYSSAVSSPGSGVPSGVPHLRPYDYDYPTAAGDPHLPPDSHPYPQAVSAEYTYENDEYARRLARSHSQPYELGYYAPDYDRVPDHSAVTHVSRPHTHEQTPLRRSGGAASMNQVLTTPHPPSHSLPSPSEPMAAMQSSSHPSVSHQDGIHRYDPHKHLLHAERLRPRKLSSRPRQVQPQPDVQDQPRVENEPDSVTSRLEKGTNGMNCEDHSLPSSSFKPSQLPSPTLGRTSSVSPLPVTSGGDSETLTPDEGVIVPSKHARSSNGENDDSVSNKRPRGRSRSMSRESQGGRDGSSVPPSRLSKIVPTEDLELSEKLVSPSPLLDEDETGVSSLKQAPASGTPPPIPKPKEGQQKDKSYVATLLEQCVKEGKPSPEFCHEMSEETEKPFKVWIIMGKERLELPASFPTLDSGKERLAKSVLGRMKVQSKMRKEI